MNIVEGTIVEDERERDKEMTLYQHFHSNSVEQFSITIMEMYPSNALPYKCNIFWREELKWNPRRKMRFDNHVMSENEQTREWRNEGIFGQLMIMTAGNYPSTSTELKLPLLVDLIQTECVMQHKISSAEH